MTQQQRPREKSSTGEKVADSNSFNGSTHQAAMAPGNPYRYMPKATRDIKKGEIVEAADLEWPPEIQGGFWRKISKEEEESDTW